MMHLLRKYDVARIPRNDAMFAQNVAKPRIIRRSRHHWQSQHHLLKANIIQKSTFVLVDKSAFLLVGITGFEPAASSSRTKRATKLRYIPKYKLKNRGYYNIHFLKNQDINEKFLIFFNSRGKERDFFYIPVKGRFFPKESAHRPPLRRFLSESCYILLRLHR